MPKISINYTNLDKFDSNIQNLVQNLCNFMQNSLNIDQNLQISFENDEDFENPLRKTGQFGADESGPMITAFFNDRHIKDVLRSIAHEFIHCEQYCENKLENITGSDITKDQNLHDVESDAYLRGNVLFRTWEDNYKRNLVKESKK